MIMDSVDPGRIKIQRLLGWPDFHPETYCHRCGRRNIESWFSPEWVELTGSHAGILCPPCFAEADPDVTWVLTRFAAWDALRAERDELKARLDEAYATCAEHETEAMAAVMVVGAVLYIVMGRKS